MRKETVTLKITEEELISLNQAIAFVLKIGISAGKLPEGLDQEDFLTLVDKVSENIHDNGLCNDPDCPNTKVIEF